MGWAGLLNTAWMLKCGPELAAFHRSARRVVLTETGRAGKATGPAYERSAGSGRRIGGRGGVLPPGH